MPQVIYLDQKCWIELARIKFGNASDEESALLRKIQQAVNENRAIFPLTLSNFEETVKITDDDRRTKLASLMIETSKGFSFQPNFDRTLEFEIINIVLRKLGAPLIDIRKAILKQGISNMVGAKGTITQKKGATPLPDDVLASLIDRIESAEAIETLLSIGRGKFNLPLTRLSDIQAMEKIRNDLWKVKDNNLRFRVFLAINIRELITPKLAKIMYDAQLPKDLIFKEKTTRKDIDDFMDLVPTALCLFTLIYHRDQQRMRPIQANDFNDIWFLTLAIPYSDIVVTERMWTSIAIRSKLDKRCGTKVFHSIQSLTPYL